MEGWIDRYIDRQRDRQRERERERKWDIRMGKFHEDSYIQYDWERERERERDTHTDRQRERLQKVIKFDCSLQNERVERGKDRARE